MIEALARARARPRRLVLVGEGPAREELAEAAARHGVERRVLFAGSRAHDAIPRLLAAFDVALVPAINPYASPLKLFEYMAAGLAVVAPDQPNLREVLADGANALAGAERGRGGAGRRPWCAWWASAELRERLGRAARRTLVERDLTWRANARRVVAAVESLR